MEKSPFLMGKLRSFLGFMFQHHFLGAWLQKLCLIHLLLVRIIIYLLLKGWPNPFINQRTNGKRTSYIPREKFWHADFSSKIRTWPSGTYAVFDDQLRSAFCGALTCTFYCVRYIYWKYAWLAFGTNSELESNIVKLMLIRVIRTQRTIVLQLY